MNTFWDRVEEQLGIIGKSQAWLTQQIGKTNSYISTAKSRDNDGPKAGIAVKIASLLNTSVEYLVTGCITSQVVNNDRTDRHQPIEIELVKNNRIIAETISGSDVITVPILRQKLSAGLGASYIDCNEIIRHEVVSARMARGVDLNTVYGCEVIGDSMTRVQMFDGDTVFFSLGMIRGNGIYVISLLNEVYVKRLDFDPISKTVKIISENPQYEARIVTADLEDFALLGKVLGWIHVHPY